MSAAALLSRLKGVRSTGDGRWLARCPAHADRTPSLSIRELDDSRVLVHDFAGCSVEEVLGAVGLEFDALFPERPIEHVFRERRPFLPSDVFEIVRREVGVVAIVASDLHKGREVSDSDYERVFTAVERLNAIAGVAYGQ
jgi:hypothetical protein